MGARGASAPASGVDPDRGCCWRLPFSRCCWVSRRRTVDRATGLRRRSHRGDQRRNGRGDPGDNFLIASALPACERHGKPEIRGHVRRPSGNPVVREPERRPFAAGRAALIQLRRSGCGSGGRRDGIDPEAEGRLPTCSDARSSCSWRPRHPVQLFRQREPCGPPGWQAQWLGAERLPVWFRSRSTSRCATQ